VRSMALLKDAFWSAKFSPRRLDVASSLTPRLAPRCAPKSRRLTETSLRFFHSACFMIVLRRVLKWVLAEKASPLDGNTRPLHGFDPACWESRMGLSTGVQ
jgi:hypothetical protein